MVPAALWLPPCSSSPEVPEILAWLLAAQGSVPLLCASVCSHPFWSDPGTPLAVSELASCTLASIRGADWDSVLSGCSSGCGVGQLVLLLSLQDLYRA